jgi:hypothetical protein
VRLKTYLRLPRGPRWIGFNRQKVAQDFVFHFPPPCFFRQLKTRFRFHTSSQPFGLYAGLRAATLKFLRKATNDVSGIFAFDWGEARD